VYKRQGHDGGNYLVTLLPNMSSVILGEVVRTLSLQVETPALTWWPSQSSSRCRNGAAVGWARMRGMPVTGLGADCASAAASELVAPKYRPMDEVVGSR
jgi:hypothetical protein